MPRTVSFVPLFLLCLRITVGAQAPPVVGPPNSAKQAEMVAHLKTFVSEYARKMPSFSCVQRNSKDSDTVEGSARSVVVIDLGSRQREQNGLPATVPIESFLRDLLSEDSQFTFVRWAILQGRRLAVFHDGKTEPGIERQADVYADADAGTISRIVLRGWSTPSLYSSYACWAN
jgi:hypothetical protein